MLRTMASACRASKGAFLRAVPTPSLSAPACGGREGWARGACHRAGRRPDPLALPTLRRRQWCQPPHDLSGRARRQPLVDKLLHAVALRLAGDEIAVRIDA